MPWIGTNYLHKMRSRAFTLLEIMVSVVVLSILVIILSRIVTNATTITTLGNKRMDTDSQVRPVLDRMVADFGQMIKRSDVDIYAKGLDPEAGNDRIAFFSNVPGYYRSNSNQSPISLVAYRINADTSSASYNRMERMGKGLLWNGVSPTPSVSPLPSPNAAWIILEVRLPFKQIGQAQQLVILQTRTIRIPTSNWSGPRFFGLNTLICSIRERSPVHSPARAYRASPLSS